jgi:hypothetical protein
VNAGAGRDSGGVLTAVSALHLAGVLALDLTAFAVLACCLHVGEAQGTLAARRERAVLALAVLAVVLLGLAGRDLAVTAVVDLALLVAVGAPVLSPQSQR